jgi:hypothetical protein
MKKSFIFLICSFLFLVSSGNPIDINVNDQMDLELKLPNNDTVKIKILFSLMKYNEISEENNNGEIKVNEMEFEMSSSISPLVTTSTATETENLDNSIDDDVLPLSDSVTSSPSRHITVEEIIEEFRLSFKIMEY